MRFASLGSGSRGNGTVVEMGGELILVDCGFTLKQAEARLARLELNVICEEMIRRLRNPKLAAEPRRLRANFINGTKEMRIRFDPER